MIQKEQTLGRSTTPDTDYPKGARGPQVQIIHRVVDALEVARRQALGVQKVQITEEAQLDQCIDRIVDVPVLIQRQRQVMNFLTIWKTAEMPKEQCVDKVVEGPVVSKRHALIIQRAQRVVDVSHVKCTDMMAEEMTVVQRLVLEIEKVKKRTAPSSKFRCLCSNR